MHQRPPSFGRFLFALAIVCGASAEGHAQQRQPSEAERVEQGGPSTGGRIEERLVMPLGAGDQVTPRADGDLVQRRSDGTSSEGRGTRIPQHSARRATDERPAPSAPSGPPSSAPAQPAPTLRGPEGRYVCQAFDYGQLVNQGEFVLQPGGTYVDVWNKKNGRWTYDRTTQRFRFAGNLANGATARLILTRQGTTAIEFQWEKDVKRWCYWNTPRR